jgi:hypothetical protein
VAVLAALSGALYVKVLITLSFLANAANTAKPASLGG